MVASIKRLLWLMITVSVGSHATFSLAAERAIDEPGRMSFDRTCKRFPKDVMGGTADDGNDRAKTTTAPRASSEFPLQQPAHPPEAADKEGTVVLAIFVTEAGLVSEVLLERSSGSRELDLAAMKITEHWRLHPGSVDGQPVCMWNKFAVRFWREGSRPGGAAL